MTLGLFCAMCAKEREFELETGGLDGTTPIQDVIRSFGWIVQKNGEHLDIYCSKRCAL